MPVIKIINWENMLSKASTKLCLIIDKALIGQGNPPTVVGWNFSCVTSISNSAFMCNYNRNLGFILPTSSLLLTHEAIFGAWEQLFPICLSDESIKMNGSDNIRGKSNSILASIGGKSFLPCYVDRAAHYFQSKP